MSEHAVLDGFVRGGLREGGGHLVEADAARDLGLSRGVGASAGEQAREDARAEDGLGAPAVVIDADELEPGAEPGRCHLGRNEAEGDGLEEAEPGQDTVQLAPGAFGLLRVAHAEGDLVVLGHVLVARGARDLLDEVDLALKVRSERGRDAGQLALGLAGDLHLVGGQVRGEIEHGEVQAQHRVGAVDAHGNGLGFGEGPAFREDALGELPATEFDDHRDGTP